jgi:hypothetical protein
LNFDDCDDSNQFIGSAAGELCNDFDDNCNGLIDEELEVYIFYADLDADGYGFGAEQLGCIVPLTGVSSNNLDCDDANAEINPSIAEIQGNQIDEDCDGNIESHVFRGKIGLIWVGSRLPLAHQCSTVGNGNIRSSNQRIKSPFSSTK